MIPVDIKNIIKDLFYKGYQYRLIHYLLEKKYDYRISFKYLQRKVFASLGLARRNVPVDFDKIVLLVIGELKNGCSGSENVRKSLKLKHHCQISRQMCRDIVKCLDRDGVERRKARRLRRRQYISKGPKFVWHLDGYDKLKPFGISIHACIDGFSRRLLWLEAGPTNKKPEVIAKYFMNTVSTLKGFPCKIRGDPGTENGLVAAIQNTAMDSNKAFIFGSSTLNQRIERWWGWLRQSKSDFWINHFKILESEGFFLSDSSLHKSCIQFIYLPIIKKELADLMHIWNTHRIRKQKTGDTIAGIPEILWNSPEIYDTEDFLQITTNEDIIFFQQQCVGGDMYDSVDEDVSQVLKALCDEAGIMQNFETIEDGRHAYIYLTQRMVDLLK